MNAALLVSAAIATALATPAFAQDMPGMAMPPTTTAAHHDMAAMPEMTDAPAPTSSPGSGTAREPGGATMHGLHFMPGPWMVMVHGYAWGVYSDQGGPRGDDKAFVASMAMVEASRPLGDGARLQLRTMLSLDPLMGDRGYPNLFATGETAGGVHLVDRQHPHDLFMELSGRADLDIAPGASLFVYAGLPGEPALGPSAFMHRASARLNPEAPITHHWFDSTHISFGVATVGIAAPRWQVEASAFNGREPDEDRWDIERPRFSSWAARATWNPVPAISAQISYGHLHGPERQEPGENEDRLTASVSYLHDGVALTAGWSRKDKLPGRVLHAGFVEANWDVTARHSLFGRLERVRNDELFEAPSPLAGRAFSVTKATAGYAYTIPLGAVSLALGGSASVYAKPGALDAAYGRRPHSFTLFAKLALGG